MQKQIFEKFYFKYSNYFLSKFTFQLLYIRLKIAEILF